MHCTYIGSKVADSCLQEVVLHRPLHEMVVHGLPGNALVVLDGCVVIALQGSEVCNLEEVLVCETR